MKKNNNTTDSAHIEAGGKLEMSKTGNKRAQETPEEIMAEIGIYCDELISGKKKTDDTFFGTKVDAERLKSVCKTGNIGEVLNHLRIFLRNKPSSAELIARLEAAMAARETSVSKPAGNTARAVEMANAGCSHAAPDLTGEPGEQFEVKPPTAREVPQKPQTAKKVAIKPKDAGNPAVVTQPSLPGCENNALEVAEIPPVPSPVPVTAPTGAVPTCFSVGIGKLSPHPRVMDVFPIDDREFEALKANMSEIGFDPRRPVVAVADGKGGYLVVDGLSRLRAAQELGITEVYVMLVEFPNDEELDYFIATTQLLRRECTDPVLLTVAAIIIPVEERKAREERQGARKDLPATSTHKKAEVAMSTSDAVGLILHRSGSTVDKIKKVLANPEYIRKVKEDGIKISFAYREIMSVEKPKPKKADEEGVNAKGAENGPKAPQAAFKAGEGNTDLPEESGNDDTGDVEDTLPVPETLLVALVDFLPEAQFSKIRRLLKGCSSQTAEFIELRLDGRTSEPKKTRTQAKSDPVTTLGKKARYAPLAKKRS